MLAVVTDSEGFLKNLSDWSTATAEALATKDKITLTTAHWEIIHLTREFYQNFDLSPAMRPLIKYIAQELGKEKASSIYLMRLFTANKSQGQKQESPARVIARLAGLPKPKNCL